MNPAVRRAFGAAATVVTATYTERKAGFADEVTPPLLAEAIEQAVELCDELDRDHNRARRIPTEEVTEMAAHALDCIFDLALWAERVGASAQRHAIENLALEFALWAVRHGGRVRALEPVVNALAHRANSTQSHAELSALFDVARDIIAHVAPDLRAERAAANPAQPWRVLNLNFAIIATRTQDP